jgi:Fe-S cluster assembly iron-binding protein IscA
MNLTLSPEASSHLRTDLDGRILRIAFTTGCGGSGYRLAYADAPNDGDRVVQLDGVRVALDDMSATRLDGAVIKYDVDEDGYLLDHPDAVNVAWCG